MRRVVAVVVVVAAVASPARADEGDKVAEEKARAAFKLGLKAYKTGDLQAALAHYRRSYDFVPRATTLFNMARTEDDLGKEVEALEHYESYLRIASSRRKQEQTEYARERVRVLRARVEIRVTIDSEPSGARVFFVGRTAPVGVTPLKLSLVPGEHRIELEHLDRGRLRETIRVSESGQTFSFELPPVEAVLRIHSNIAGAIVTVDGVGSVRDEITTLDVTPGQHVVEVTKRGYRAWKKNLSVAAGERVDIDLTLDRERSGRSKFLAATFAVGGVLSGIGAFALGIQAQSDDDVDKAKLADVFVLTGVASLVTAGIIWYVSGPDDAKVEIKRSR